MNNSLSTKLSTSKGEKKAISETRSIVLRLLSALFGGYGVGALACALLAQTLHFSRIDAVLFATMLSFGLFAATIIRVFSVKSLRRVVLEPTLICLSLFLLTKALI